MVHIQMPAFRKKHKTLESVKDDSLFTWLYMLDRGYKNENEMEELSDMTEGLRNFAKQYNYAINDPDLIRSYRMVEDGKRDIAAKVSAAEAKGESNAHLQDALAMKADGLPLDLIARYTGLSSKEILEL